MTDNTINLLTNDILGSGRPKESINYHYDSRAYNKDVSPNLYIINSSLNGNAGTVNPSSHDDSRNGDRSHRGHIFRGDSAGDSNGYRVGVSVKYNRYWGGMIGDRSVPSGGDTDTAWLHGVKGIECDWKLDGHWGYHRLWHFGLTYANRNVSTSKIFYLPLIFDGKLYSGVRNNYTGYNIGDQKSSSYSNSRSGRFSLRGNQSMCDTIDNKRLVFLGAWFACHQEKKSDANKQYYTHFYNGKPLFSRDGLSSNYKAILPYKKYSFQDACDGYIPLTS